MVGAFALPETVPGMIEASTTRDPASPRTRRRSSTTALVLAHAAGANRMVGSRAATADKVEQIVIARALGTRLELLSDVARHCRRLEDMAAAFQVTTTAMPKSLMQI